MKNKVPQVLLSNLTLPKAKIMLKIGVLGAGHLGKIHLKLLKELKDHFELVGFFDPNSENSSSAIEQFQIKSFDSVSELIAACDVIDIVTPTLSHFDLAKEAIRNGKHIFIEKPVTNTPEEAKKLISLVEEAEVKAQVGHVERFNPAYTVARPYINNPMFIEAHRLAQFNPRGTDVSVVLDLMIHDIDIILSMVDANIRKISASGVAIASTTPDICNARLEFDNGCVANLTASRISLKNMRKTRVFRPNAYISVDFLEKKVEIVEMEEMKGEADPLAVVWPGTDGNPDKQILFNNPEVSPNNAIKDELQSFAEAIENNKNTAVPLHDGYRALEVAHMILAKISHNAHIA